MISLISFTFSIYLMFRFILDIDADAGEGRTLPLMKKILKMLMSSTTAVA